MRGRAHSLLRHLTAIHIPRTLVKIGIWNETAQNTQENSGRYFSVRGPFWYDFILVDTYVHINLLE